MDDKELQDIKARAEAATPGPWLPCVVQKGSGEDAWVAVQEIDPDDGEAYDDAPVCDMLHYGYYQYKGTIGNVPFREAANKRNNAEFIAHARQDVPKLLAEIERLKAQQPDHTTT